MKNLILKTFAISAAFSLMFPFSAQALSLSDYALELLLTDDSVIEVDLFEDTVEEEDVEEEVEETVSDKPYVDKYDYVKRAYNPPKMRGRYHNVGLSKAERRERKQALMRNREFRRQSEQRRAMARFYANSGR